MISDNIVDIVDGLCSRLAGTVCRRSRTGVIHLSDTLWKLFGQLSDTQIKSVRFFLNVFLWMLLRLAKQVGGVNRNGSF